MSLKVIRSLPILDITNASDRVLTGSKLFPSDVDESMTNMVMPNCVFSSPAFVGPYVDSVTEQVQFKPVTSFSLFTKCDVDGKDICLSDINQGMIGDCWFLSAIDFSANHPLYCDKIRECVSYANAEKTKIQVKLHDLITCQEKITYVDPRILVNGDYMPVTVSVKSMDPSEIWPAMLEKGLAKMCGGYPKIEGGWMSEGMCFLHGGRGYFISSHDLIPKMLSDPGFLDAFCEDLKNLYLQGYGVFTAWSEDVFVSSQSVGLVNGHAYSLLDFKKVEGEWVFMIKNPWGKFEWNGKYSDRDITSKIQHKAFGLSSSDDGIFIMSASELFGRCEGIDLFEPKDKHMLTE